MKAPTILIALTSIMMLFQTSCAVRSTAQSRIARHPEFFAKLSTKHKDLVSHNRVTEGMSKEAVYLAWGDADEIKKRSRKNRIIETWVYLRYQPVYTRRFGVGYGYGHGRGGYYGYGDYYRYGGYYGNSFGYGTDVTYLPYLGAKVEFTKGRVSFWETTR